MVRTDSPKFTFSTIQRFCTVYCVCPLSDTGFVGLFQLCKEACSIVRNMYFKEIFNTSPKGDLQLVMYLFDNKLLAN